MISMGEDLLLFLLLALARTIQAKKRRKAAGKPRPPRDLIEKKKSVEFPPKRISIRSLEIQLMPIQRIPILNQLPFLNRIHPLLFQVVEVYLQVFHRPIRKFQTGILQIRRVSFRILRTNDNLPADNGNGDVSINGGGGSDIEEEGRADDESQDIRGSDDDEQEDPKDYCKGGYHPVTIGSSFNQRYHVIRKLGWGTMEKEINHH